MLICTHAMINRNVRYHNISEDDLDNFVAKFKVLADEKKIVRKSDPENAPIVTKIV